MASRTRYAVAVLAASLVPGAAPPALAGESGTFEIIMSFVRDFTTFEHAGQTVTGGSLEGTFTVVESSGGPFVEGANSLAACLVHVKRSPDGVDLEAPCVVTDSSGDMLFIMSKRTRGDVEAGGGGDGREDLVGGTGKYAGITGSCTYTANYLDDDRMVSSDHCTWQRK